MYNSSSEMKIGNTKKLHYKTTSFLGRATVELLYFLGSIAFKVFVPGTSVGN